MIARRPSRKRASWPALRPALAAVCGAALALGSLSASAGSGGGAGSARSGAAEVATAPAEPPCDGPDGIAWYAGTGFYEDNPTYVDPGDDGASWRHSSPGAQGMDARLLGRGIDRLASNGSLLSVLIVRHDRLVEERYFHGGAADHANNVHSASKSMLQALVSIAVRLGDIHSLDDPVATYLPQYFAGAPPGERAITIRDLLSMSSGLHWVEDNTEYRVQSTSNWLAAILGQKLREAPGTRFDYSTGDFHVLSAVLQAATGMSTCRFAQRYLFGPIGIAPQHWGVDPTTGTDMGGCDLYMTPRDMARFGLLYLHGGTFDGRRIVPSSAIRDAARPVWNVGGGYRYAQGWWVRRISGVRMFFAWGFGGQFIYVIPSLDVVFVTSEDTSDGARHTEIDSGAFIRDFLIPSIVSSGSRP